MKPKLTNHLSTHLRHTTDDHFMDRQAIDKILDVLKNGKQHTLEEITKKTEIKEPKIRIIIAFLKKYQFIDTDKNEKIKLTPSTKQFLDKLDETDPNSFYEEITA